MAELDIVQVGTQAEMEAALSVRRAVFIEEQGVPESMEIDEHDGDPAVVTTAVHVLGLVGEKAVATGRLIFAAEDGRPHIGRVAVLKEERGKGYGWAIMLSLQYVARQRRFDQVILAAQLHAIGFYERLGYVARGDVFLDAGIEHRWMDLSLR